MSWHTFFHILLFIMQVAFIALVVVGLICIIAAILIGTARGLKARKK